MQHLLKIRHETNNNPLKELRGKYVKKDILVNIVRLEAPVEQIKQKQSFRQSNNNPNYDNQRRESQGW